MKRRDSAGSADGSTNKRRRRNHVALAGEPIERIDLHVGRHADHLVDDGAHRQIDLAALALHDLDRHDVAGVDAEPLGQPAGERDAVGRHVDRPQRGIVRAPQFAARRQTDHRRQIGAMSRAQAHRHDALALDGEHARLAREVADDAAVERMREGHHRVAAFHQVELDLDHLVDGVAPEQAEHDHRHGEGNAENGRAPRATGGRQDCEASSCGVASAPRRQQAFNPRPTKAQRRGRTHGDGGRQADDVAAAP